MARASAGEMLVCAHPAGKPSVGSTAMPPTKLRRVMLVIAISFPRSWSSKPREGGCPRFVDAQQSYWHRLLAPADSIDRTAPIHVMSMPDRGAGDRPRPPHDAGPYDAPARVGNVVAVH